MAVGAGELVGQVAGLRAAFGQIAMLLAGDQGQDRPGRGEAGFGIAIARCVQMDGMRARRQIVQIEPDDEKPSGTTAGADRFSPATCSDAFPVTFVVASNGSISGASCALHLSQHALGGPRRDPIRRRLPLPRPPAASSAHPPGRECQNNDGGNREKLRLQIQWNQGRHGCGFDVIRAQTRGVFVLRRCRGNRRRSCPAVGEGWRNRHA